ncbi:molybdopterin molybdotransferase MoeA [Demequina capsici]|uniref:Molybdopterin molybdenumtransferase n=1 Tax=Demequina capsici TaxID=3075620 RepID=A0AA96JAS2_9MICO|nr:MULTISPECIES: gephyrin-like molybdotransferase Glp [unclassified Demequina]WNM25006.1 molybdopterin molybdotransferase MoeA [Demequina sp. OYTSA14]WNM27913.1 molybdopterin molybdotransferase MoeA [Demequina sp. PMTSA13]
MTVRSLTEHRRAVSQSLTSIPDLSVLIADAAGATLAEDLVAERPVPAYAVADCDGYAIRAEDVRDASPSEPVTLIVSHDVSVEARIPRRHISRTAARLASGAPLPEGADTVVPAAMTDGGVARVVVAAPFEPGAHVRAAGSELQTGRVLVPAGTRIGPRQLAVAAALGRPRLLVHPTPRVVVIAVGSELVDPGASRGGVAESNGHMLAMMARDTGAHAFRVGPVPDDRMELAAAIEDQLVRADVLITTGGLSGGREETLPEVLAQRGEIEVVELALRPGTRHGFGFVDAGGDRRVPVIALPGRPVAAAVAFQSYVKQALLTMSGRDGSARTVRARLAAPVESPVGVAQAVPVRLVPNGDVPWAEPIGDPANVTLADIASSDALLLVAEHATALGREALVECHPWER